MRNCPAKREGVFTQPGGFSASCAEIIDGVRRVAVECKFEILFWHVCDCRDLIGYRECKTTDRFELHRDTKKTGGYVGRCRTDATVEHVKDFLLRRIIEICRDSPRSSLHAGEVFVVQAVRQEITSGVNPDRCQTQRNGIILHREVCRVDADRIQSLRRCDKCAPHADSSHIRPVTSCDEHIHEATEQTTHARYAYNRCLHQFTFTNK